MRGESRPNKINTTNLKPTKGYDMYRISQALVLAVVALSGGVAAAEPTMQCGNRTKIVEKLQNDYNERSLGVGLTAQLQVVELKVAPGGETWTLLVTLPNGKTCLVAFGTDWAQDEPQKKYVVIHRPLPEARTIDEVTARLSAAFARRSAPAAKVTKNNGISREPEPTPVAMIPLLTGRRL